MKVTRGRYQKGVPGNWRNPAKYLNNTSPGIIPSLLRYIWTSSKGLDWHWGKHKGDYPQLKSKEEYEAYGEDLFDDPDTQKKKRSDGRTVAFNAKSRDFGVYTPNKRQITMYRQNQNYYDRQK